MLIDKNKPSSITFTISADVDNFGLQRLLDYAKYLEATAKSKAKQADVDDMADKLNASWWKKNKKRFIQ
jgi:hypothetical protein